MESHSVSLKHKPSAALRVSTYLPGGAQGPLSNALVVFLNGLGLPRAAWSDAVGRLLELRKVAGQPTPALFCYDRYGQGESEPDPTDPPGTPYGHDARAVIADLHELLTHVADNELRTPLAETRLVFVCNSIGCALARLYAAEHPGLVEAFLFLDPMVANSDFVSLIPDPDAPGFDSSRLPAHVSVDDLRYARAMVAKTFLPTVPNGERFDRRRLADLLPDADKPILPDGPGGKTPRLVVAGHDWDEFAEQCKTGPMALPIAVVNAYVNPAWGEYNEGLTRLVQHESRPGGQLKIAKGCGHFIQKDDPQFVAIEIDGLLKELAR